MDSIFYNHELEKGFINMVLSNPELIVDVIDEIDSSCFIKEVHRKIFNEMQKQFLDTGKISITKILLYSENQFGKSITEELLNTDFIIPMEIKNVVRELNQYKIKRMIKNSLKISHDHLTNPDLETDIIKSNIQDEIFSVTSKNIEKNIIFDVEEVAMESLERFSERQEGKTVEKIRTGIKSIDGMLSGGLSKKHLSILAGRPSMGKTAMSLILLSSILTTSNTPTLFVSLEMDRVKLLDRILIQKSKVASDDFYNTKKEGKKPVTDKQKDSIEIARNWIHEKPLKITDSRGLTVKEIKSIARKTDNLFNNDLGLIIIDYLTEVKTESKGGRWDKGIAEAVRELRSLANELDCHIMLLHQINRDFKNRGNKRPQLSDLRDSGEIEEKADNVLFVHRPQYYKSKADGNDEPLIQRDAEFIIAKQREGKTGVVSLVWYPEIVYFQDYYNYETRGKTHYLKNK